MVYLFPPDIEELIVERMSSGRYPSREDLLREALQALKHEDDDLVAVREAIADWHSGEDGLPLSEAFAQVRHNLEESQTQ